MWLGEIENTEVVFPSEDGHLSQYVQY